MIQFIPLMISLPLLGFWLWMFVDMANNEDLSREARNTWFVAFVFLNIVTACWYFSVEYRPRHS